MRSLKDIRTATKKRAKGKRTEEIVKYKPGNKTEHRSVSGEAHKKLKIKEGQKKKSQAVIELESRKKAYGAGDNILEDAYAKAKEITSNVLRDSEKIRQIKSTLTDQSKQAGELTEELSDKIKSNEETEKNLDSRDESIKITERNIHRTREKLEKMLQESRNITNELGALITAALTRLTVMEDYDKEIINRMSANVDDLGKSLNAVQTYQAKQNTKDEHQERISEQVDEKELILDDGRTSLDMAAKEINRRKK